MGTLQSEVVIIGGGPAGLAISYSLAVQGLDHVVLEQGRLGENWRSKRWDSLCLVGPNWAHALPGCPYRGDHPGGFMAKDEVVSYLERYAQSFRPPLQTGVRVTRVEPGPAGEGFLLRTDEATVRAESVVVATGAHHWPKIPACSGDLPGDICQLPACDYRNLQALPPGAVLVVGSGESGCQIAEELRRSGRTVYLSVGRCWWLPRRYRGEDCVWWVLQLGMFDMPAAKGAPPAPQCTGWDGGRDLNLHTLGRDGVVLLGHLRAVDGHTLRLAPDLQDNLAKADEGAATFLQGVDSYIRTMGLAVPEDRWPPDIASSGSAAAEPILELDLHAAGIRTVIWATGYRLDFGWIKLPTFDADGYPLHEGGVAAYPGLYFPTLPGRDQFFGVARDAAHIAGTIATRAGRRSAG